MRGWETEGGGERERSSGLYNETLTLLFSMEREKGRERRTDRDRDRERERERMGEGETEREREWERLRERARAAHQMYGFLSNRAAVETVRKNERIIDG